MGHHRQSHATPRAARAVALLAGAVLAAAGLPFLPMTAAHAADLPTPEPAAVHTSVVSQVPAKGTPQFLDGRVQAVAQVGSTIVVGGTFTKVAEAKGTPTYAMASLMAFDEATGAVRTTFVPGLVGGSVFALVPGPVPNTVFVGGSFSKVGGVNVKGLTLLDVTTGAAVPAFKKSAMNGQVSSLKRVGERLFVGGTFTSFGGSARGGLAAVNTTTGALDGFLANKVTEHHNFNGTGASEPVGVDTLDVTADGRTMAIIGNFKKVDGLVRDQAALIDLTGATAVVKADWRTRGFEMTCNRNSFDSSVRGMTIAPDGKTFTVVSTGGPTGGLCDTVATFSTTATGDDVKPLWITSTGGDSLYAVANTGQATYVGGHQRWLNNPGGADKATAGAVPRAGVGALSPTTGVPLSWNPGRHPRGVGVMVLYATSSGLWMGSDTDWVGYFEVKRPKLSFFPLAGGAPAVAESAQQLPGAAYQGTGTTLTSRNYDGTTLAAALPRTSPVTWTGVKSSTLVGDQLYLARTDDKLYRRSFDGKTFGPETLVDPYNDPKWATLETGSGTSVYRGVTPWLAGELANMDSMWFDNGRLYYVLHTSSTIYYRAFSPDSGIAHATRGTVPGVSWSSTGGAFVAGGSVYVVGSGTGNLSRYAWVNGAPSGSATVVSGPTTGIDWRGKVLFFGKPFVANALPVAVPAISCSNVDCTADATGSSDADGTITSYAWAFGDGSTAATAAAAHRYAAPGTYQVTLTVTDNEGGVGTATTELVIAPAPASPIEFRAAAGKVATFTSAAVAVPAEVRTGDAMALVVTTASAVTASAPAGWTRIATVTATDQTTTAYAKIASATDAGTNVKVTLSGSAKMTVQLMAYAGAALPTAVTASGTGHQTPPATVATAGSYAVWYWAAKSAAPITWATPAGSVVRDTQLATGTGAVSSVIADTGEARPTGTVPSATASASGDTSRGTALTLLFAPSA